MQAMIAGRLPSITWNKLKFNESTVQGDVFVNTTIDTATVSLPAGVTKEHLSVAKAQALLKEHSKQQKAERFVAGKKPLYHPQAFGTGLGKEFHDFVNANIDGVDVLRVAAGTQSEDAILWETEYPDGSGSAASMIIYVEEGANATVIMHGNSKRDASGCVANATYVIMEAQSKLTLCKSETLGNGFVVLDDVSAEVEENAEFKLVSLSLGGQESHVGTEVNLTGRCATFRGTEGYLALHHQIREVSYNVIQRGKKTESQMTFDGVMKDQSRKTFRGTIDFRNGSAGSIGDEQENVLLLSPDVMNKTIPVILCEEEDVEGRHGATVGRMAEDMLFYLETRGLSKKAAEEMMVRARLMAVTREIPNADLVTQIHDYIEEVL